MLNDISDNLFEELKNKSGQVTKYSLLEHLEGLGILDDDPRLQVLLEFDLSCSLFSYEGACLYI